jgi:hypothetical protein
MRRDRIRRQRDRAYACFLCAGLSKLPYLLLDDSDLDKGAWLGALLSPLLIPLLLLGTIGGVVLSSRAPRQWQLLALAVVSVAVLPLGALRASTTTHIVLAALLIVVPFWWLALGRRLPGVFGDSVSN